jgi:tetratricopeptide (TPR) repeat protein
MLGLIAGECARPLHLDVLPPHDARELLRRALGGPRVGAEPDYTMDLVRLCAGLPLALRLAAANLAAARGQRIAEYVTELRSGDLLSSLEVPGDDRMATRPAMRLSYLSLPSAARVTFRLLALLPAVTVTAELVRVVARETAPEAERLIGTLANASLLEHRSPGRFAFHDLLRRFGAECAERAESAAERDSARGRLFAHYLDTVETAARQAYPHLLRLPSPAVEATFADGERALSWLDDERENLLATIQHTAQHGPFATAYRLADGLRGYFSMRLLTTDWLAAATAGLQAARAAGDAQGTAAAEISLLHLYHRRSEYPAAIAHGESALAFVREAVWPEGEISALGNLANVYRRSGEIDLAIDLYQRVLVLADGLSMAGVQASTLGNLAAIHADFGRLDVAHAHHRRTLAIAREISAVQMTAQAHAGLGETRHAMGDLEPARSSLEHAVAQHHQNGDRGAEAEAMRALALVLSDLGHRDEALRIAQESLALVRRAGQRHYEADVLSTLADIFSARGEAEPALRHASLAVRLAEGFPDDRLRATALIARARARHIARDLNRAREDAAAAVGMAAECGFRLLEGVGLTVRAEISADLGDVTAATAEAAEAIEIHRGTGHRPGLARAEAVLIRFP